MHAPILSDLDIGGDHGLPGMAVGIGEIAPITAIVGLSAGLTSFAPFEMANSITASTSSVELQFHASVMPRNACGRGWSGRLASSASWPHGNSPITVPPVSKNATASPVTRNFREKPSAS